MLQLYQRQAHCVQGGHARGIHAGLFGAYGFRDILIAQKNLPFREAHGQRPRQCRNGSFLGWLYGQTGLPGGQCRDAVHRPGVEEMVAQSACHHGRDRAFAGSGRAVDADHGNQGALGCAYRQQGFKVIREGFGHTFRVENADR